MHHYHFFFFFNDTATTEIYTLSLHDALPIFEAQVRTIRAWGRLARDEVDGALDDLRSEEHTSELQSRGHLVCRLLLEKKKKKKLKDKTLTKKKNPRQPIHTHQNNEPSLDLFQ